MHPELIDSDLISESAKDRIRLLSSQLTSPMGAYCANSKGHRHMRESIADFITARDNLVVKSDWQRIYLTNGASEGVRLGLKILIR